MMMTSPFLLIVFFFSIDLANSFALNSDNQKNQEWSLEKLTAELLLLKQQFADSVPVGFVYFQLSNQPEPKTIWAGTNWQEITSQYKNLFFRALGDESAKFGEIQEESSPKLTHIRMNEDTNHCNAEYKPIAGVWNDDAIHLTGGGDLQHIQFFVSKDKVRPKNTAIKIWKRV